MHLQSLELFGFKSFADKTVFKFHEGVTAIVGPNGCGKSNVLDAVRWVLGEQSAKSLRGGEMADVIFNGTDNRKPVGFAEVSLTFSDCAEELEVDWNEIRVTRRVYRDGNSEYFLNKTVCRLRDIQNLFADTGVARAAYSMMEQGKIDMILSSRPEDRRAVFEEAAGITKYKTQKREALRKLEATEANLLRIDDIIKEVKRQIGSLQRQAGKARRYQALHADLRTLDTHFSRKQLDKLEKELTDCRTEISRLARSEHETRDKINRGESELSEQRRAMDETDKRISDGRTELQRLQNEIGTHHKRIEFNRERASEFAVLIERARKDTAVAEAKRTQQQKEIEQATALVEKTKSVVATKEAELKKLKDSLSKIRVDRAGHESQLKELETAVARNEERIRELEEEISGIKIRREATQENQRDVDDAISETNKNRSRVEKEIASARKAVTQTQKDVDLLRSRAKTNEETLLQHRQALAGAEKDLIDVERGLAEKQSRLEILRQLDAEGEGLAQGSQAVLKGLDDPSRIKPALSGAFVSQLDVDPRFVGAIEAALGRNLQAIVLDNPTLAPEIFSTLAKKKLGQAALVIPKLGGCSPNITTKLPEHSLGWAIEKVKAPESLAPIIAQLLHNVALFDNLDHALSARQKDREFAAATLNSEFISAEGIIFGGSSEAAPDSLLQRKSRISILSAEIVSLSKQRETSRHRRDRSAAEIEKANCDFEKARLQVETADREQSISVNKIQFLERDLSEIERKVDSLRSEHETFARQINSADDRVAELEHELESERTNLAERQTQQNEIVSTRDEITIRETELHEKLNELRLELATEQQRHENLVAQRQPMTARETELSETIAARGAEIADFEKRLRAQADESKDSEVAMAKQTGQLAELEKSVATLVNQRAEELSAANEMESSLRNVRNGLNELHDSRSQQQVRESQLQMKIDNLAEQVQRRYQVDLRGFVRDEPAFDKTLRVQLRAEKNADVDPAETERVIAELRQRLDEMGPVNLDAVHEYDELEERYKFLESQNNDLTNSRRELLDVIAKINSTTRKLFAETFAQVQTNFREMFAELFGGGRADLSLMDENDPLNCGIEISAKPPGKQLQSVSLLSGGERAMTAVALLFAIYMVRPSPFCVLDEIDAPLDESNINRFIRVLERFVEQSQFIIITHNKRTIAKADILYGVTMEERGVSKLVGMKLTAPREVIVESASNANGNGHTETAIQRHLTLAGR
jgi:chromosome segregation protein